MKIQINKEIPREVLENIFVTAFEGGSNYWMYINKEAQNKVRAAVPKTEEECFSIALFKAVYDLRIDVPVHDAENEEDEIGLLSFSTMEERLQKMVTNGNERHLTNELEENGDAESSDAVFQYLVLGEIVYG